MLFGSLNRNSKKVLFLGSPEAEAEANFNSRVKLIDVYEDWHDLFELLSFEKFIIVGRKGAGKSAFARYAQAKSMTEPNLFVDFVTQEKINLEKLVQLGTKQGHIFEKESIFKWLIYTHLVQLFTLNEATKDCSEFEQLRQFLRKNRGFVNITEMENKEFTQSSGFEVNIEPLKRFYRQKIKKDISIKAQKAPFYKLLPHLEEIILVLLRSHTEKSNNNSYIIFFDDLDVNFDASNTGNVDNVVSLLRSAKSINNNLFGKNEINAKAIILLRDDVEKFIADKYPDTAKMMTSYTAPINWYQDDFQKGDNESELNIKKFIDLRIVKAFEKVDLPCMKSNPWNSLVDNNESYDQKSSFKYILDHTLFRPRDLLLLFSPLEKGNLTIPLSRKSIQDLLTKYSSQLVKEFRNEISSFYTQAEITQIFKILDKIQITYNCSYSKVIRMFDEFYTGTKDKGEILNDLFDRSIIGSKDSKDNYQFKYREPIDGSEIYKLNDKEELVMHYGFRLHFQKNKK